MTAPGDETPVSGGDGRTEVALKVDVDTDRGARLGIPRLAETLRETQIRASFFVTMGPDHSGRALGRMLRRKGFLRKMVRTRALSTYGWRTVLSGTLLPAPRVGSQLGDLLRSLESGGHEVGPHGWNHVAWHDRLRRMDGDTTHREFERGFRACEKALGHAPVGSAAPGWQCTSQSLAAQDHLGVLYHSDTRGTSPFRPVVDGRLFRAIEIPTTLPTLDELLGIGAAAEGAFRLFAGCLRRGALNVFTLHAEMEGMRHLDFLRGLLEAWRASGAEFVRMRDVAERLQSQADRLPRCPIDWGELPGRPGEVACQGSPLAA